MINRRQFALGSNAWLAVATADLDRFAVAEERSLSEQRLVELGLNALARAPQQSYFADGHRGASMISAHLMCVDNDLGTRLGPQPGDRKIKDHRATDLRPDEFEYWNKRGEKSLGIGHVFKYPYAFYDLLARANDPELEKELDSKAWQLF